MNFAHNHNVHPLLSVIIFVMRLFSSWILSLVLVILSLLLLPTVADPLVDDEKAVDLEEKIMRETISAGRGERDEVGVRDQWSSTDHLGESSKFDTRKRSPSAKARRLLREYRLECNGCDHNEATAKINAFVLETKERARRRQWLERAVIVAVTLGAVLLFLFAGFQTKTSQYLRNHSSGKKVMRLDIEEERRRQAFLAESRRAAAEAKRRAAPTWRDIEEREVWTAKQEKQFAKALLEFGGIPPKERYHLIATRVDDKSRQECLMHHKLLKAIAKEQ